MYITTVYIIPVRWALKNYNQQKARVILHGEGLYISSLCGRRLKELLEIWKGIVCFSKSKFHGTKLYMTTCNYQGN